MTVCIGVDIGQRRNPTALCVAEMVMRGKATHFLIRHLDRLPLGTPYPQVASRVAEIAAAVALRARTRPTVYVDATGVGKPVVDLLKEEVEESERIVAVYFTHGDRRAARYYEVTLGKAFLVSRVQTLLQTHRVHLPKTSEADALAQELLDYEIRVDENANDRYGAFKVGAHDDLVTALGLAVQTDEQRTALVMDLW